jgi:penicillin-binding protein-related factor A (putative recombinase)
MAANSGKLSESHFLKQMEGKGKTRVFRLRDAADLYGLNKKKVAVFGLPADFIVVSNGKMFFAEVKSTQNKTSFSLDCLTPSQRAACLQTVACGGDYRIYIHNMVEDVWYILTGEAYMLYKKSNLKSVKWEDLCILTAW